MYKISDILSLLDEFTPILIYKVVDGARTIIFEGFVDSIPQNLMNESVIRVTIGKEQQNNKMELRIL